MTNKPLGTPVVMMTQNDVLTITPTWESEDWNGRAYSLLEIQKLVEHAYHAGRGSMNYPHYNGDRFQELLVEMGIE